MRVTHELGSLAELENVTVGTEAATNRRVLLKHVAEVRRGTAEASSISRTNGQPSLSIAVSREEGANIVDVSAGVLAALEGARNPCRRIWSL